jgi:hypothetical protein
MRDKPTEEPDWDITLQTSGSDQERPLSVKDEDEDSLSPDVNRTSSAYNHSFQEPSMSRLAEYCRETHRFADSLAGPQFSMDLGSGVLAPALVPIVDNNCSDQVKTSSVSYNESSSPRSTFQTPFRCEEGFKDSVSAESDAGNDCNSLADSGYCSSSDEELSECCLLLHDDAASKLSQAATAASPRSHPCNSVSRQGHRNAVSTAFPELSQTMHPGDASDLKYLHLLGRWETDGTGSEWGHDKPAACQVHDVLAVNSLSLPDHVACSGRSMLMPRILQRVNTEKPFGNGPQGPSLPIAALRTELKAENQLRNCVATEDSNSGFDETSTTDCHGAVVRSRQLMACPFYKRNWRQFSFCCIDTLTKAKDVKEHIFTRHRQPIYCPRCYRKFNNETTRDEHIRTVSCPRQPQRSMFYMTDQQQNQLQRISQKLGEEDQWFKIWAILFPDRSPPDSPYVDQQVVEWFRSINWGTMSVGRAGHMISQSQLQPQWEVQAESQSEQPLNSTPIGQLLLEWHFLSEDNLDFDDAGELILTASTLSSWLDGVQRSTSDTLTPHIGLGSDESLPTAPATPHYSGSTTDDPDGVQNGLMQSSLPPVSQEELLRHILSSRIAAQNAGTGVLFPPGEDIDLDGSTFWLPRNGDTITGSEAGIVAARLARGGTPEERQLPTGLSRDPLSMGEILSRGGESASHADNSGTSAVQEHSLEVVDSLAEADWNIDVTNEAQSLRLDPSQTVSDRPCPLDSETCENAALEEDGLPESDHIHSEDATEIDMEDLDAELFSMSDALSDDLPPLEDDDPLQRTLKLAIDHIDNEFLVWRSRPLADSDGTQAAAVFMTPTGPASGGPPQARKRPRADSDDGAENTDARIEAGALERSSAESSKKFFACPFWKHDREKYIACIRRRLTKVSYVKQH